MRRRDNVVIENELVLILQGVKDMGSAVSGFSKLLVWGDCDEKSRMLFTWYLRRSTNQLLNTVDEIIALFHDSNNIKPEKRFIEINDVLIQLFRFYSFSADNKGVELICKKACAQPDSFVWTDEPKLLLLLEKLLDNALKYTDAGQVEFGYTLDDDNQITLYVQDTGMGIKEKEQKKVFDLFYRSPEVGAKGLEGTGLGLSIVSRLAGVLGTEVKLQSVHGQGSRFWFSLKKGH